MNDYQLKSCILGQKVGSLTSGGRTHQTALAGFVKPHPDVQNQKALLALCKICLSSYSERLRKVVIARSEATRQSLEIDSTDVNLFRSFTIVQHTR
jgi:hypothetical protein